MCFGVPGQVIAVSGTTADDRTASVVVDGVTRVVSLGLLDDADVEPGAWVLIHLGYAMECIDADEARELRSALQGDSET
jgi:hydrogenase assembly chaperone HypC/HupF